MVAAVVGLEGGVEALEEGVDAVGPASGEVVHDAEHEDADDEHVGLEAAVPRSDEAERVGRGFGPAELAQQEAEVRRVEEGARVSLEAADFRVSGGEGIGIDELIDHRQNEITIEGAGEEK